MAASFYFEMRNDPCHLIAAATATLGKGTNPQKAPFLPYLAGYVALCTGDYKTAPEELQKSNLSFAVAVRRMSAKQYRAARLLMLVFVAAAMMAYGCFKAPSVYPQSGSGAGMPCKA